jgi:predicted RNA-binding Zn ribbon-like protein
MYAFELTGGDPALDFANTRLARRTDHPEERLGTYEDLLNWARQTKLLTPQRARYLLREAKSHPSSAARAHKRANEVRELIFRTFTEKPPDTDTLRRLAALHREALRHRHLDFGGESVVFRWDDNRFDSMLWPVVDAAVTLLTSDAAKRVRACEGSTCLWLFIDKSRQRNRRWCDMSTCGNRAKARRHYRRRAGSTLVGE